MLRVVRWLGPLRPGSGPLTARLFHCAISAVLIAAWSSLGLQIEALIGSRGLLPIDASLRALDASDQLGFWDLPTLFWLGATDFLIGLGVLFGVVLSVFALIGVWPRVCFALSAVLYLSYSVAGDIFTAFQWDNLLVETCALAALLPIDRARPLVHFLFRVLLFKLYFESGIAKWQSHLGDWQDGSAMTFYFETAPLPTWVAWYAHQLPQSLLRALSWATLFVELVVPFLIFGPRRARLFALVTFTLFQALNTLTANYGFFTYLALTLHLFLFDDAHLAGLAHRLPHWVLGDPSGSSLRPPAIDDATHHTLLSMIAASYTALSLIGALVSFAPHTIGPGPLRQLSGLASTFRVANVYHLFGHITRERIEPTFEAQHGDRWIELQLPWKAGDPTRAPTFVAPHQPRLDFRLWFYGLSAQTDAQADAPYYVQNLVSRLCRDPESVQRLFETKLPARPDAIRIRFYRYRFSSADEHAKHGTWWTRHEVTTPTTAGPMPCISAP